MTTYTFNPETDLVLDRAVDVRPGLVWDAWTKPEHLRHWFAPAPWTVSDCAVDLHPGGKFNSTLRSPEGEEFPNVGCILEIEEGTRLVFTSALGPGYRPRFEESGLVFTAVIDITPTRNGGTKYTATVMHPDEATRKKHDEMGFHDGWGQTFDQMVEYIKAQ